MSLRRSMQTIRGRFIVGAATSLLILSFLVLTIAYLIQAKKHRKEVESLIIAQTLGSMSTHLAERRQQNYLALERILPKGELVESIALYDKKCRRLTTTYLSYFPENECPPTDDHFLVISYPDVLSPIGKIVLKITQPKTNIRLISYWFSIAISLIAAYFFLLNYFWKSLIYSPLKEEISNIAHGAPTSFSELDPLSNQVRGLIENAKIQEAELQRIIAEQEKFQTARKVAHDILAPLQRMQENSAFLNLPADWHMALGQIKNVALDLLPEKARGLPENFLVKDAIENAIHLALVDHNKQSRPKLSCPNELRTYGLAHDLTRALANIIKNAIEAQPANSPIRICAYGHSRGTMIEVTDDGPGFSLDASTKSTKERGSGVGIASAMKTIARMGGALSFSSSAKGTTAQFVLLHPRMDLFIPQETPIYLFGYEKNISPISFAHVKLEQMTDSPSFGTVLSPFSRPAHLTANVRWITVQADELSSVRIIRLRRILLVDDDKYVRKSWEKEAKEAGIEITTSPEPLPIDESYDAIFLDQYLGDWESTAWGASLKSTGHAVFPISSLKEGSKQPAWLS